MEKERQNMKVMIMALIITVVSLSVAFAATLSSVLNINGTVQLKDAKWDVYFASATKTAGSTLTATAGPTVVDKNTITYQVQLEENKYFEFDAVVKNDGTYTAKLSSLTLAGAEDYADLITYSSSGLALNGTIAPGGEETITIKVAMGAITNDNIGALADGKTLNLTVVASFVQE